MKQDSANRSAIAHKVGAIVASRGTGRDAVIPILQDIQQHYHYLPEEALEEVCRITAITPAQITGVATFYSRFRHEPAGKHIIRVCTGTACHVKGSGQVYEAFRREMKLEGTDNTDAVGIFTLEEVACLGCCTLAPVVKIDEVTYGHVKPENVGDILRDFLSRVKRSSDQPAKTGGNRGIIQGEIRIGLGSCCMASGSSEVKEELERTLAETSIHAEVRQVGCVGICNQVPILEIVKPGEPSAFYAHIRPEEVRQVVLNHFRPTTFHHRLKNRIDGILDEMLGNGAPPSFRRYLTEQRDTPLTRFLGPQLSIATECRGELKPCDIEAYRQSDGFEALEKALFHMTSYEVINEIRNSGLRGRGGAGFPTGIKWQLVKEQPSPLKYVICNGDEGDPGAFMDRMLLESYPFRIIEGMLIAGYATGASQGIFYIRAEYPLAVTRIREALQICEREGITGHNILSSSFSFNIRIFEGAGAFVCGEETALISSIEGRRGIPALRPPYPAVEGLYHKPTLINNTETLAVISRIIRYGADSFSSIGTTGSKGTKVFALAGKVKHGGLIEVPMGTTIHQIVMEIGGGIAGNRSFKAVQIGGPSGGCLPAVLSHLPIDYEALSEAGAMMGSGGMVVLDDTDCMVDLAWYFLSFTQDQSCGQCTFCRVGTRRMLDLLEKIRGGQGTNDDLVNLENLALAVRKGSFCGLGKTAPNPVLTTLRYFRHEYEAHLRGECPAGKCSLMITYAVTENCIGCTKCAQRCPSGAIAFKPYEIHHIDTEKCTRCDICRQVCPVQAVILK
ncbi:MAG TPA: NAD(P)H-dependent oxidoreductase subunit E [Bacteroidales bacterium]|nr:NAD(P)H-dependent oxidoreductase subunit E [Bacteroidales bacterium]